MQEGEDEEGKGEKKRKRKNNDAPAAALYMSVLMASLLATAQLLNVLARLELPVCSAKSATLFSIWYRKAFRSAGMIWVV